MRMRTIDEAHAELLEYDSRCCLTKSALRRLVKAGTIPSMKVGNKCLIDADKLDVYLDNCMSS